jgi:hypothetical protein
MSRPITISSRRGGGAATVAACSIVAAAASADIIIDGGFETQATRQSLPGYNPSSAPSQKWGAGWNNWGWTSWQGIASGGTWTGGVLARTEEYATGWKWAHTGDVFAIIKDRQTMSQTFTATQDAVGTLTWFDANRASWRDIDWYGRPNDYSVTVTDSQGNTQTIGTYTSQVAGGNSYSTPAGNGWWTTAGKSTWFARTGAEFQMQAGVTYTLSFNSLSPYWFNADGSIAGVDDRSTFLDDITLTAAVMPSPGAFALLGMSAAVMLRRKR